MANLKWMIQHPGSTFGKNIKPENKTKQVNALKYIELLAMQANIPVDTWNIFEVFKGRKGSECKIVTNPRDINKRLFTTHAKQKDEKKWNAIAEIFKYEDQFDELIANHIRPNSIIQYIEDAKSSIEKAEKTRDEGGEDNVGYWKKRLKNYEKEAKKHKTLADRGHLFKELAKVLSTGFWSLLSVDGSEGYVEFVTTNDIVLFDKSVKSKLNLQKNMGRYSVQMYWPSLSVAVHSFRNNWVDNDGGDEGNIHPYIPDDGDMCFGNSGRYFSEAAEEGDIVKAMNILSLVISTYNSAGGPHTLLTSFIRHGSRISDDHRARSWMKREPFAADPLKIKALLDSTNVTEAATGLAKSIGKNPIDASNVRNDDEDDYYEDDGGEYEDEEEDGDF